jgi:hypothetical protein
MRPACREFKRDDSAVLAGRTAPALPLSEPGLTRHCRRTSVSMSRHAAFVSPDEDRDGTRVTKINVPPGFTRRSIPKTCLEQPNCLDSE